MKSIRSVNIIKTTSSPLNSEDRAVLVTLRKRKLAYLASTYVTLLCILAAAWVIGVTGGLNRKSVLLNSTVKIESERAKKVAPILFSFFFLALTIFFIKYYLETVHLYNKDIKGGNKNIVEFECIKYQMPFFNRYYLKTPVEQKQVVEISKDTFEGLGENESLVFEIAPYSLKILNLKGSEGIISYY